MFFSQIKQEEYSPQGTKSAITGEFNPPFNPQLGPFVMGTPSSINQEVLRKLCAKFHTFVTSVTFWPIFCTKRPDYKGLF